jgi:hypothetical protein
MVKNERSYYLWVINLILFHSGLIKVNQEFSFSINSGVFIFRSGPGFQFWVSNLRFTSYFNFSFNLFLRNCWLLVFGFLKDSAVKPSFWTFFSVNYWSLSQQPRMRVLNLGFKIQVFNFQFLTRTDISFSRFSNF